MKNYFIYLYTFPNGKYYIGQTFEGSDRCGNPNDYKQSGNHKPQRVWYAMMKYKHFEIDILKNNLSLKEANYWETYFIKEYDSIIDHNKGYNCNYGGDCHEVSEYTKKKISEETRKAMRTEEVRNKLSKAMIGKHQTEETVLKRIQKLYKPILQYTKDGEFIKEWNSATDVDKELHIDRCHIASVCKGKRKSAGNYIWKYKQEEVGE